MDEDLCFSVPADLQFLVLRSQAGGQEFRSCACPCAPPGDVLLLVLIPVLLLHGDNGCQDAWS